MQLTKTEKRNEIIKYIIKIYVSVYDVKKKKYIFITTKILF